MGDGTDARSDLRADCAQCVALCCVVTAFARSADFAIDKPAGTPCLHLRDDHRCSIHEELVPAGFPGCVAFDCFGAGQRLAAATSAGRDWTRQPGQAALLQAAFPVLLSLHELLWYLHEALTWRCGDVVRQRLRAALDAAEAAADRPPGELPATDVVALQAVSSPLLRQASAEVRAGLGGPDRADADLVGADLRGRDLRGGCFRGALLLGADLREADLSYADLRGADLRGTDLHGARLHDALCLTRRQLGAARGDAGTTLPRVLERPANWS